MDELPRISFGMIVLNGEPFLRYTLRALYPVAHEILVVEGAAPGAAPVATADGHSRDSTLATLRAFQAEEDPQGKLQVITREGFWSEKDEMSQAYAERATGDYLWQVDVDEFYQPEALQALCEMLRDAPSISAVSFHTLTFWGAPDVVVDGWYLRRGAAEYHRLFKWAPGYRYTTHRPPTVVDAQGQDLRQKHWLRGEALAARGIFMFHYSLLLPKQVREKCEYYSRAHWAQSQAAMRWLEENYLALRHPFHVHNVYKYPSCLYRYDGAHPPQLQQMWQALPDSPYAIRQRDDVDALLNSRRYRMARWLVMRANVPALYLRRARIRATGWLARILPRALKDALKRLLPRGKPQR